jgi:hypothetical protein
MDDSERSYGYSKDIYHGKRGVGGHYDPGHTDGSYESDGECDPAAAGEPSPEEAAMHVVDREEPRPQNPEETVKANPERPAAVGQVESFTWENEDVSVPEK